MATRRRAFQLCSRFELGWAGLVWLQYMCVCAVRALIVCMGYGNEVVAWIDRCRIKGMHMSMRCTLMVRRVSLYSCFFLELGWGRDTMVGMGYGKALEDRYGGFLRSVRLSENGMARLCAL